MMSYNVDSVGDGGDTKPFVALWITSETNPWVHSSLTQLLNLLNAAIDSKKWRRASPKDHGIRDTSALQSYVSKVDIDIFCIGHKCSTPQLVSWKTNESVVSVIDYKHNSQIRDEVFEVLQEVDFEEIMDQEIDSDEEILSDDANYASDLSEYDTDYVERFVPSLEIHALNDRTKHCIHNPVLLYDG
ncbi:hypothetical protein G5I_10716 [Acromyrmex echinatior]|uniref:Uncharacterized protein n=1 Tax=Acromyrmex echinatior TaxID=103372 RepID=F4WXN0_ACREC|nr:hypothetical protein G5I_10716 [Acromyrmex echinatior]